MPQNIIDVSWDLAKFDAQTQVVLANMTKVYELAGASSSAGIKPGSNGGYTELIKSATEFNKVQQSTLKLTSLQEKAEQARLKTQLEAAKATKAQEAAEQARLKTQVAQEKELERLIALEEKQKAVREKSQKLTTIDGGSRDDGQQIASPEAIAAFEARRQAEAEASMAAAEYGRSVTGASAKVSASIPISKASVAVDKELEAAKLALVKANSAQNESLQGYKVQTQAANKAAKEQAMIAQGMLTPYQLLNKEYLAAQLNAKDLAVQYGVNSVQAKEAAASAMAMNVQLQAIDKTVGQSQRNVGNYTSALRNVWGGLRKLAYMLPGIGIAGILAFGIEPIVNFYKWLTRASDATQRMIDKTKLLTEVRAEADKQAGKEITDLKLVYEGTQNVTLGIEERTKAAKFLQDTYPDTFKNFTTEQIMVGDAAKGYEALAASILKAALASAARSKIEELAAKKLDIEFQKTKIKNATTNEANKAHDRTLEQQTTGSSMTGGGVAVGPVTITRAEQLRVINKRRDDALKVQDDANKKIDDQIKFLTDFAGSQGLMDSVIDDGKKTKTKKEKKDGITKDSIKEALDLEFELYKISQQRKIKLLDEEQNDTKKAWQERIIAAGEFQKATIELSDKTFQHEIDNEKKKLEVLKVNYGKSKGTEKNNLAVEIENATKEITIAQAKQNDARIDLEKSLSVQFEKIKKETEAERLKTLDESAKSVKNVRQEQQGAIDAMQAVELGSLDKLLKDKLISQEDYNKRKAKFENDALILSLQSQIKEAEGLRTIEKLKGNSVIDFDNKITELTGKLQSAQNIDGTKNKKKDVPPLKDSLIKIGQEGQNLAAGLVDIKYQKEIDAIQKIIDLNNERKEQEIANINASTLSNQEKAAQMLILDNTVAANNKKLEREKVAMQIKQAKFDRDMAILSIMENAAIAIFKLPAQAGFAGIAAGIAIGVEAAAQIAMLLAKPLPQMPAYATGTDNHPGGPAIVGEGKYKELIQEPGGKSFIASRPMLMNNLPKGSKVIPLTSDMIIEGMTQSANMTMAERIVFSNKIQADSNRVELAAIKDAVYETGYMTAMALKKQKAANVNVYVNTSWEAYITKSVKE